MGSATTHDLLTYSAKAITHKSVHPALRYGLALLQATARLTPKYPRHGQRFDFIFAMTDADTAQLAGVLRDEVRAARDIRQPIARGSGPKLLHRRTFT